MQLLAGPHASVCPQQPCAGHTALQLAQLFREFQPEDEKESFELQLALCNSYGEEGDVAGVRAQLPGYLEKYRDIHNAVAFAYIALLKAYRCAACQGRDVTSHHCILQCVTAHWGHAVSALIGVRSKADLLERLLSVMHVVRAASSSSRWSIQE